MKNLFDFATKELSQDAFLRWFFESYKDEEIGPIVVDFIKEFTTSQKGREPLNLTYENIQSIETLAQCSKIDVIVIIRSKDFEGYRLIAIEDKVGSAEHNQLKDYNAAISKWKNDDGIQLKPDEFAYKIYYKTSEIEEDEKKRVNDAGWTHLI